MYLLHKRSSELGEVLFIACAVARLRCEFEPVHRPIGPDVELVGGNQTNVLIAFCRAFLVSARVEGRHPLDVRPERRGGQRFFHQVFERGDRVAATASIYTLDAAGNLLGRELLGGPTRHDVSGLDCLRSREGPAGSALSLVFHGGDWVRRP